MEEVKLHGCWDSPFSHRVVWALELKDVKYEYIEEDLANKSQLLLKYNPVHKKIPVLVHGGKPIPESLVILEYIEETWPQNPLWPTDAYDKAKARFWIKFGEDKNSSFPTIFLSTGEKQEAAVKEAVEMLKTLEEQGLGDNKFFGGETIGLVDICYGWLTYFLKAIEVVADVKGKLLEPSTLPRLCAWAENFKQVPVIKENLPDQERLLAHLRETREKFVASHI